MTTMHIGLVIGAVLLCQVGCVREVKRQPDATALYDAGERLYADRSYDEALEALEESFRLDARPQTALKLADCHDALDDHDSARALRIMAARMAAADGYRQDYR